MMVYFNATRLRRALLSAVAMAGFLFLASTESNADLTYSYGNPATPLNDGYIVSTSNATLYTEGTVTLWKPVVGNTAFSNTTPAEIVFHFPLEGGVSSDISLWMNMPTFNWSYSRGHNFLYGSTDGSNWELMAEIAPPARGSARDLGTVNVPDSLLGATDFWIKAELYSYGPSASRGGALTNTAQLSRWDRNANNTSFSLDITTAAVPEPSSLSVFGLLAVTGMGLRRRRQWSS